MRLTRPALFVAFASMLLPITARADSYDFTIQAGPQSNPSTDPAQQLSISGTLSGPADGSVLNAFDITSITGGAAGQSFGYTFTGVVNPGTTNAHTPGQFDGYSFDNVLYNANTTTGPYTSTNGFLVYLDSSLGQSLAHVFYTGGAQYPYEVDLTDPNDPTINTPFSITSFTVTPSAVPEPGTMLLLATGALSGAGVLRRRFSSSKEL